MKRPYRVERRDDATGKWECWATYSRRETAEEVVRLWDDQFVLRIVERKS